MELPNISQKRKVTLPAMDPGSGFSSFLRKARKSARRFTHWRMSNLSGKDWWVANQARYPKNREIGDLEPDFRSRVEDFIGSLRDAGAEVVVHSTRRNATRAFLMHYSWKVAFGQIDPKDVPKHDGLRIEWDHGNINKSREAAEQMVKLFNLAHLASLDSNHIRGRAIDMTISWKDTLLITRPARPHIRVESHPRSGENRELHEIGASVFGVHKHVSDPPHWSSDGT